MGLGFRVEAEGYGVWGLGSRQRVMGFGAL